MRPRLSVSITVGGVHVAGAWELRLEARGAAGPSPTPLPTPLQVEGRWLTIRLAASHAHLVSPADPLRLALHSIRTRDEDLQFVLFWT